jgi:hypothetical protein
MPVGVTACFEACFKLDDDGCPGSERKLRLRVLVSDTDPCDVTLDIVSALRVKQIGTFVMGDVNRLADLLYPVARVQTVQTLVPND